MLFILLITAVIAQGADAVSQAQLEAMTAEEVAARYLAGRLAPDQAWAKAPAGNAYHGSIQSDFVLQIFEAPSLVWKQTGRPVEYCRVRAHNLIFSAASGGASTEPKSLRPQAYRLTDFYSRERAPCAEIDPDGYFSVDADQETAVRLLDQLLSTERIAVNFIGREQIGRCLAAGRAISGAKPEILDRTIPHVLAIRPARRVEAREEAPQPASGPCNHVSDAGRCYMIEFQPTEDDDIWRAYFDPDGHAGSRRALQWDKALYPPPAPRHSPARSSKAWSARR